MAEFSSAALVYCDPRYIFEDPKYISLIRHPSGNVECVYIEDLSGKRESIMWRVQGGTSYPPENHEYPHRLTIMEGNGIISVAGVEHPYGPKSSFWVGGNVPHGLVRVDSLTIVLQSRPYIRLHRP